VCGFQGDIGVEKRKFVLVMFVTLNATAATKNDTADIKIVWLIIALVDLPNLAPAVAASLTFSSLSSNHSTLCNFRY
jgi:hypothetical protein